jgi:hypothetical protein
MKNLTKSFSYFFFFLMLGFVACKSSDSVDAENPLIGRWKMTALTYSPLPQFVTQKDFDDVVVCVKDVVLEFTATKAITSGKDCYGNVNNQQTEYTFAGGKFTEKGTGKTSDISVAGNTFTQSTYDATSKVTIKTTHTRL